MFDIEKLNIIFNEEWKDEFNTETDFPSFTTYIDSLKNLEFSRIKQNEVLIILENTLKYFEYEVDSDYELLIEQLQNFIFNDNSFTLNDELFSKTLFQIFYTVKYHQDLIEEFKSIKKDNYLKLIDKGTAYSANRDASETTIPIINAIQATRKILEENKELENISILLEKFNQNPYEVIAYISSITESTLSYFKAEKERKILKIVLEIKKVLNASQGLKISDFIHSMKFSILSFLPYSQEYNYGFSSQEKFIFFLNDILEHIINTDCFKFDSRDLNQKIQKKDYFNGNVIFEKITKTNKKKDPIFDNPEFLNFIKESLKKALI